MLEFAAALLVLVGAMHSFVGGKRLIAPLLGKDDFPVILGSQQNGRVTLWFGWHALTLFWWSQAAVIWTISIDEELTAAVVLASTAVACAITGLAAVIATKGRHLSWVFFFPIAAILGAQLFL